VIIHLRVLLPAPWCGLPVDCERVTHPPRPADRPTWPCSRWGLPSHGSHLPRWWSLTPPFHPYLDRSRRSALCGTVPRVTPGGRYPPPCPVESGLSSTLARRDHPADSSGDQGTPLRRSTLCRCYLRL